MLYHWQKIIIKTKGGMDTYYLNGYDIKDNQITVNVIAGYVSETDAGYGLYKDPTSTELLIKYEI